MRDVISKMNRLTSFWCVWKVDNRSFTVAEVESTLFFTSNFESLSNYFELRATKSQESDDEETNDKTLWKRLIWLSRVEHLIKKSFFFSFFCFCLGFRLNFNHKSLTRNWKYVEWSSSSSSSSKFIFVTKSFYTKMRWNEKLEERGKARQADQIRLNFSIFQFFFLMIFVAHAQPSPALDGIINETIYFGVNFRWEQRAMLRFFVYFQTNCVTRFSLFVFQLLKMMKNCHQIEFNFSYFTLWLAVETDPNKLMTFSSVFVWFEDKLNFSRHFQNIFFCKKS